MYFEDVYDLLMDESVYEEWQTFFKLYFNLDKSLHILDLGCGSAQLTIQLAQAGFKITGLDLSEDMLARASFNQGESNTFFPLVQADMTDLSDFGFYDGIISSLDSICYLENQENVSRVFNEAYVHLNEGGYFIFDVHSTYQMEDLYPGYMYNHSREKFSFMWTAYQGKEPYSVIHDMDLFIKEDKMYRKKERTIKEKTYPLEDYQLMLKSAGFTQVNVYDGFGKNPIHEESPRWFFVCKK
ncbi:MAG: class I SAM-dependent methyltransferase [Atopococcus tabaci]|uniref:Class I SAM-dependent methyltransferase n=1 Tax=Atopococcus tabaci TaxID=269774 RepID=A0AA43UDA0_9LACT|nr:class I SAM-dependent methyltransferase [Atopococcus tabaci]